MEKMNPADPNEQSPTISVVLATHAGESFIAEQLKSLTGQLQKPLEIIVSDDASPDRTIEIIRAFSATADIPIILHQNDPALGFSENFMTASTYATGDLIAFCDQDDIWHPEKLATISKSFTDPGIVLAVHTARMIDQDGKVIGMFDQDINKSRITPPLSHNPWGVFFGFSMVFRRSLLGVIPSRHRGVDYISGAKSLAHDRWILYLANLVGKTSEIAEPLVDYRQHGRNLFGAELTRPKRSGTALIAESSRYLESATQQRAIIDLIPATITEHFPLFDRAASEAFWNLAIAQQSARHDIYLAPAKHAAVHSLFRNILNATYRNVHDHKLRWQSPLKDLLFIAGWYSRTAGQD